MVISPSLPKREDISWQFLENFLLLLLLIGPERDSGHWEEGKRRTFHSSVLLASLFSVAKYGAQLVTGHWSLSGSDGKVC